jgi:hypothetical protein
VRLEGLDKLKKCIHLIGSRTRDLPACSIVPQRSCYCVSIQRFLIMRVDVYLLAFSGRKKKQMMLSIIIYVGGTFT